MGIVYRARQRSLDRSVALKIVRDELAQLPEYRQRFLREARLAASINHPHVVPVFDIGEYDGRLLLAMQWIEGEDLRSVLAQSGRLSPERAVKIVAQLAGALDAVHRVAGLVHRDVKPSNVLIQDVAGSDHAYLTDFGVARSTESGGQLTQTGLVVGTAGYLSPEQIRGEEPGPRSDLYALGCLFFEMATGKPPFRGDNEMALRWAHANDPRPLPSSVVPELGTAFDAVVAVSLAIDPAQRFASGQEFADALGACLGGRLEHGGSAITPPHEPTVIGPSTPLPPAALQTPHPPQVQVPGYGTPASTPGPASRGGNPLALVLLAIVAVAGIAAAALVAAGVFAQSGTSARASTTPTAAASSTAKTHARASSAARSARRPTVKAPPPVAPAQTTSTPPTAPAASSANGSVYGLQGLPVQCGYGVAGSAGMTCTFANNAFYEYWKASGGNPTQQESINVWSALGDTYYPLSCSSGDTVVDCTGQNSSGIPLDARFTQQALSSYTSSEAAAYAASGKLGPDG
jgi:serine/threonine protein kinase